MDELTSIERKRNL